MRINELELYNYRNFERLSLGFNEKCNLFVGENGQGKTNLLEAIYMLSRAQTFRPADSTSFINFNSTTKEFYIRGTLINKKLNYLTQVSFHESRKQVKVNGKKVSTASLAGLMPTLLFSPESLSAIKGSSQERRNLIDEMIIINNPENFDVLSRYSKALRARNRLLKDHKDKRISSNQFNDILTSITEPFLKIAVDLTLIRILAIRQIEFDFQSILAEIFGSSIEVKISYLMSSQVGNTLSYEEIYDALHKRAKELSVAEISAATSLVGPHRHDIEISFDRKNSRFFCSQGQQRALILALKFAQIMYHHRVFQKYPVLLLDDVLSELDLSKKMNLLDLVGRVGAQVFMTTTDRRFEERLKTNKYTMFEIQRGIVTSRPS